MVLCRNVFMYLEESRRREAIERVAALLAPDGLLLLDPAEHLGASARLFRTLNDPYDYSAARRDNP